jgi:hypothetical protein
MDLTEQDYNAISDALSYKCAMLQKDIDNVMKREDISNDLKEDYEFIQKQHISRFKYVLDKVRSKTSKPTIY